MFIKKFDYLSNTVIHLDGRKFARMSIKWNFKNFKYKQLIKRLKNEFESFSNKEVFIEEIYKSILPHKKIIFDYFEGYLSFVFKYEKGQITEEQDFGKFLKDTLSQNHFDVIEFGTWNGLGSTKIIFENSKNSDSVEINPFIYGIAKKNLMPIKSSNRLLIGRIKQNKD